MKLRKFIDLGLNLALLLLCEPNCLEMLHVSGLEMLKLALYQLYLLLLSHIRLFVSLQLNDIIERVAQVFSRLCLMLPVVAHAEPAELVAALRACHMHATFVLLNF